MKKVFTFTVYQYVQKNYNLMFEEIIHKYGITQIEIDVLAFLANNPEYKRAQDIVNKKGISKAHVSLAIQKLIQKKYIERKIEEDCRRCNELFVKEEASTIVKDIQDVQKNFKKKMYDGFSQDEIKQYDVLLDRIYKNLGGEE